MKKFSKLGKNENTIDTSQFALQPDFELDALENPGLFY